MSPLNVVLVRPKYSGNIGSTARVCANMDAKLHIIENHAEIDILAHQNTASAQQYLEERQEYNSLDDFYIKNPSGVKIAFSRRMGKRRSVSYFPQLCDEVKNRENLLPVYFMFGPEDHGFSQMDLSNVNFVSELPTFSGYGSMNLSHAVLLALYIFREKLDFKQGLIIPEFETTHGNISFPDEALKKLLILLGYDIQTKDTNAHSTLKSMILRSLPTNKEKRVLEKVLQQLIRFMNQN